MQAGQQVKGTYFGVAYSGTLLDSSGTVRLDQAIVRNGRMYTSICVGGENTTVQPNDGWFDCTDDALKSMTMTQRRRYVGMERHNGRCRPILQRDDVCAW